jgi:pimeloyl-ACP methyl ester carboxylesterase
MLLSKPVLVLIPGTLCDERMFFKQAKALKAHVRVVHAGYARLRRLDGWASDLLARLPARFSVAGFSLGGLMALELLRRAPERIERLALIASNAQGGSARGERRSAWLRRLWLARGMAEVARQVKPGYFHHEAKRRAQQRLVLDMALRTPRRAAFAQFAWSAGRPDGREAVAAFRGPLLAVSGANDRLVPRAWQQALCDAQPATCWLELPRCGHFVPLEEPARLREAIIQWIKRPVAP